MTIGAQAEPRSPYLMFLPYLPLKEVVAFAGWELGPVRHFDGRWTDGRFEDLSKRFLAAFHGPNGSSIGYRIEEGLVVPPPRGLTIPLGDISPDPAMLQAIYDMAVARSTQPDDRLSRRLVSAIDWLAQAWRNSESIRPQDRIVLLKTGFESLTGKGQNWPCAKRLRTLYENRLMASGVTDRETTNLLWTPSEVERFDWTVRVGMTL
jgi:hypothetical protein